MYKKLTYTFFLVISIITINITAQPLSEKRLDILTKNCFNSLTNENPGIVESAIFVSIQFKNRFPDENDSKFVKALDQIANESDNPRLSYKAQLAKIYFNNTEWFNKIKINSILNEQKIYKEIAETINKIMFTADYEKLAQK